jgi:hypothetical protein
MKGGVNTAGSFQFTYALRPVTIARLRSMSSDRLSHTVLVDGADAILGVLDVLVNGKHVFELSERGFRRLVADPKSGLTGQDSRTGLNGACIMDWFLALLQAVRILGKGASSHEFDLAHHGFWFRFRSIGDRLFLTVELGEGSHPISPFLVTKIESESVALRDVRDETASRTEMFLREVESMVPALSGHRDVLEARSLLDGI